MSKHLCVWCEGVVCVCAECVLCVVVYCCVLVCNVVCVVCVVSVVQMINGNGVSVQARSYMQLIGWQNTWKQAPGVPATPSPPYWRGATMAVYLCTRP